MINLLGGEQDNVVFMGRRSFRMEIAGMPGGNELAIPLRASEIPTERIFGADRERVFRAAATAASRPSRATSNTALVALCLTTFALGIALTLTLTRWAAPRRALSAAPVAVLAPAPIATPAPPAPTVVIQPLPIVPPTDAALLAAFVAPRARHPLAKPARIVRPRPVAAPAVKPWVDPFAE